MKPKLREVRTSVVVRNGQPGVFLSDPLGLMDKGVFVPRALAPLLMLCDGTRDLGTLRAGFELRTGVALSASTVEQLLSELDGALLLDNERSAQAYVAALQEFRSVASRAPIMAGKSCPGDPQILWHTLQQYFDEARELEPEEKVTKGLVVNGLVSPHIDFERGGPVYAQVWRSVAEAVKEAELAVILGTDHTGGGSRITLTRQNYRTPWGIMPTAQEVVEEVAGAIGQEVFQHELHHRGEHSIEAAAIWLHHLLGGKSCQLLPILCGSFQPFLERGENPIHNPQISSAVSVLQKITRSRHTLIVAATDLAHVGPAFGDSLPIDFIGKAKLVAMDKKLIDIICQAKAEDFFEEIRQERDQRRICGLPPIYLALSVLGGSQGFVTGYSQCPASQDGGSLVSICGVVLGRPTSS